MTRIVMFVTLVALLLVPSRGAAQARVTGADLHGTVADQSGGVLVEASVTVTNVQTNVVRTTETEAGGRYSVPALPPGKYIVTAARSGFTTERREDIDLFLGESVTLDFALTIAPAEQTVTVRGEEPLVQTNRTGLSSLVNQ
ncbi:MAG: carboxypeptidase-like regulatory domain-containing protein, partial [Vicinamibacterales bacterium]